MRVVVNIVIDEVELENDSRQCSEMCFFFDTNPICRREEIETIVLGREIEGRKSGRFASLRVFQSSRLTCFQRRLC